MKKNEIVSLDKQEEIVNKIHEYCMNLACVYESRPFGKLPICYRVAGKIFAQVSFGGNDFRITLKTNPEAAMFYREAFPGVVVRGYHCPPVQQPYWNTIDLNRFKPEALWQMIDEAYQEVIARLPKKEQKKLPEIATFRFQKTDGENPEFVKLCRQLDCELDELAGRVGMNRTEYEQYNQLDRIHDVMIVYKDQKAVGAGAYRFYDEETVEIKRLFLKKKYRQAGIGKELLRRLEADARIQGFRYAVLETGDMFEAATGLYKKMGYQIITNYGQYANMPESVCMKHKL